MSADLAERETDLGKLMHDLRCPDPERMHYKALRERARYLKRSEEGIGEMSGEFDRILKEKMKENTKACLERGRKEMARSLLAEGSFSVSKIAKLSKLPVGEVERIKNGIKA